jgi:hypothetical protein
VGGENETNQGVFRQGESCNQKNRIMGAEAAADCDGTKHMQGKTEKVN